jgi:hypothetical protein
MQGKTPAVCAQENTKVIWGGQGPAWPLSHCTSQESARSLERLLSRCTRQSKIR